MSKLYNILEKYLLLIENNDLMNIIRSYTSLSKTAIAATISFVTGKKASLQGMKKKDRDSITSFQSILLSSIKLSLEIFDDMCQFNSNTKYQLFLDNVFEVINSSEDTNIHACYHISISSIELEDRIIYALVANSIEELYSCQTLRANP